MKLLSSLLLAGLSVVVAAAPAAPMRAVVEESTAKEATEAQQQDGSGEKEKQQPERSRSDGVTGPVLLNAERPPPPRGGPDLHERGPAETPDSTTDAQPHPCAALPSPRILHIETGADLRAGLLDLPPPAA